MELFDKKFVRFMWDDELEGKEGFCADDICELINCVHSGNFHFTKVTKSLSPASSFKDTNNNDWLFFYYDPNYEVKRAFNEGKKIQVLDTAVNDWVDCDEPLWCDDCVYRVKPEDEKWIAYVQCNGGKCRLSLCVEDRWWYVQGRFGAKTRLFVGAHDEVKEWCNTRQKFAPIIKAWEDGKTVQYYYDPDEKWVDIEVIPHWNVNTKYRVKSEEKEKEKKYRPYTSSAEMTADFKARFKASCTLYTEPLVWVKHVRDANGSHLITDFFHGAGVRVSGGFFSFEALLCEYTYLDGSPCGMEVNE